MYDVEQVARIAGHSFGRGLRHFQPAPDVTIEQLVHQSSRSRDMVLGGMRGLAEVRPFASGDLGTMLDLTKQRADAAVRSFDAIIGARALDGPVDLRVHATMAQRATKLARHAASAAARTVRSDDPSTASRMLAALTDETMYRMPQWGRSNVQGARLAPHTPAPVASAPQAELSVDHPLAEPAASAMLRGYSQNGRSHVNG